MNSNICLLLAFVVMLCYSRCDQLGLDENQGELEAPFPFLSLTDIIFNENIVIGISRLSMLMVPTLITAEVIKEATSVHGNVMDILHFQNFSQDVTPPDLSKLYGLMFISAVANYILGSVHIERYTARSFLGLVLSSMQFSLVLYCSVYAFNETGLLGTAQVCAISRETAFLFNFFTTMLVLYPYIMRTLETANE